MTKKVASKKTKQVGSAQLALVMSMQQLVLPLVVGIESTKRGLLSFVHEMGMAALQELLVQDAQAIAGPKGKRNAARTHHHWGTTRTQLPLGGRHVTVERPRVRRKGGDEATLPMLAAFSATDTLPERVMEQILLGVSTRGYAGSLDPVPESLSVKGASKSAASRALVKKTTQKLEQFATSSLAGVEVVDVPATATCSVDR
jgi:putative transposase